MVLGHLPALCSFDPFSSLTPSRVFRGLEEEGEPSSITPRPSTSQHYDLWSGNSPDTNSSLGPQSAASAEIHHCPGEGLAWPALAQQPGAASSFPVPMFVFKFLRPVSALPGVESAGPGLSPLPSFACLTRLVCRVGHLAKPLPLTVQQLGPESLDTESWEALGYGKGSFRGPPDPLDTGW